MVDQQATEDAEPGTSAVLCHCDPNINLEPELEQEPERCSAHLLPTLPSLPPEVIRHHLLPALSLSVLRNFRHASKGARDDVSVHAIRSIKRAPGTHPLPRDLGTRFPCLARLDLSGDSQLEGDATLKQALASASQLISLNLAGCSSVRASFVRNSLTQACPRLQHLALSCCCAAEPDTEAAVMAALAAAPLAGTLTSLELHCGGAFQPELRHIDGVGQHLTSLRVYGNRTMDDVALTELPRVAPKLVELQLAEQQSRRGRHIRGEGLTALRALVGLRALMLQCAEPDARSMATSLAALTQLTELDLSRCEPRLVEALAPLGTLLHGEGALLRLSLPSAYTARQLERSLPAVLGGSDGGGSDGGGGGGRDGVAAMQGAAAAPAPPALQALRLQTSAALPEQVLGAMWRLRRLRELNLSYCGPAGSGTAMAGAGAALSGLTALRLVQEYGDGGGSGCLDATEGCRTDRGDGVDSSGPSNACRGGQGQVIDDRQASGPGVFGTWYDALLSWRLLRHVELTYAEGLDDSHLDEMGRSLHALSYFCLSRNTRATGAGLASWPAGCRGLTSLTLYDCARVGDAALSHVAALPLRSLTLAHLPAVGAAGMLCLARGCTTLRTLVLERLAGMPGAALAPLWRLPLLETLCVQMCANVNNQTLQIALQQSPPPQLHPSEPSGSAAAAEVAPPAVAEATAADELPGGCPPADAAVAAAPTQHLTWLQLQGALVSTSGLWALRHAPGLTHLDLSYCASVGDGVADVLLHGGGRPAGAAISGSSGGGGSGAGPGVAQAGTMLIPSLVHVDLRGCKVSEATLDRLRLAGLAVNQGSGTWR